MDIGENVLFSQPPPFENIRTVFYNNSLHPFKDGLSKEHWIRNINNEKAGSTTNFVICCNDIRNYIQNSK
jgi:hypothetical protein